MHCTGGLQVDFCGQTEGIGKVDCCVQTKCSIKRNREVQTEYFAKALEAFGYVQNKNLLAEHTKRMKILTAPANDNAAQFHKLVGDACHQKSAQGDTSFLKKIFACPECGDLFLMRDALDGHLRQVHKQRSGMHKQRNQRGLHKKKHKGRQSFECQFCQKLFMKEEHLGFHLRNHADERNHVSLPNKTEIKEKPFQCQFCEMGFNRRELRDRHLRTHLKGKDQLGEKRHKCADCGECFTKQSYLACHQMLHGNYTSPNVCPNCGRSFTQRRILIQHMLSEHTDGRPYACLLCGKMFTSAAGARKHEDVFHNHHLYHCDKCGKKYSSKCYFTRHLQSHHDHKLTGQTSGSMELQLTVEAEDDDLA